MTIRIGGFFSGIGAHHSAAERLGLDYEMVFQCEFDARTARAYDLMHGETPNLGDITQVHDIGGDLRVDVLFWTPPCQDISVAGRQAGAAEGSGTRTSLAFEVPRILGATPESERPRYLVMEEVPALVSKRFRPDFDSLMAKLSALGYRHTWRVVNATEYDVGQNRRRLFVVSMLGSEPPAIPSPVPRTKVLRDYMDDEVDEKYYLSAKRLEGLVWSNASDREAGRGFRFRPTDGSSPASTVTTKGGAQDGQLPPHPQEDPGPAGHAGLAGMAQHREEGVRHGRPFAQSGREEGTHRQLPGGIP